MCELIGRVDADPDVLPRTENFGVDYIEFSKLCPTCPPEFLELTYNCVKVLYIFICLIKLQEYCGQQSFYKRYNVHLDHKKL